MTSDRSENEPVTFVDKRKIDPDTGEVREAAGEPQSLPDSRLADSEDTGAVHEAEVITEEALDDGEAAAADQEIVADEASAQVAELTETVQRLQADFTNFRRRVERDKQADAERAKASVASALLPVLDDLDRARAHGDLEEGPLKAITDKLGTTLTGLGLSEFGAEGEAFDPELHEAVQHEGEGNDPVLGVVMRKGYKFGDRVLRHAMVGVTDRPDTGGESATEETK